ncbi:MAG: alpha/beta fold hydrolase [Erysipelotrichaceae bacterium]|nr:alpha/beta fold hydrolase [Erysipelotrichaceae bacterium]
MNNKKTFLKIAVLISLLLGICGCRKQEKEVILKDRGLIYDTNFGGAYVDITIDEFNALGFKFGDSINMDFSNGYQLHDIPYYNGYYVNEGDPLLVGYPGYPHVKMGFNYGEDMWIVGGFKEDTTVTITINEKEKYLAVQEARELSYDDQQGDKSDEVFGNYRTVKAGNLQGTLMRSASPCDNQHNRAGVVDRLIEKANVNFIINLSDNTEDIEEFIKADDFNSPYFLSLYKDEKVIPLGLTASYKTDDFIGKLINGLSVAAENPAPYLVHCVEGKDRTGYVCMLLEALAGASYEEIIDDYMITYDNYYGITPESDSAKYNVIRESNIDKMLEYICGNEDYHTADLQKKVSDYLISAGMNENTLEKLKARLTGETLMQDKYDILYNTVHTYRFRMDYFRFGSGEKTMVILPGLSVQSVVGSAQAVAEEYKVFAQDYTVYVFDRRNNLESTQSYSVAEMAEDTTEAFRLLGLKNIDLFGASQGGMIALKIALDHPELVGNLVLGSSACKITEDQYANIAEWIGYARTGNSRELYLSFGEMLYPKAVYEMYESTLIALTETVTREELRNFIIVAEGTKGFDVSGRMNQITCPLLALEADDDRVLGKEAGELINELMKDNPKFEYYVYSGYGHAAFDTAAPEYQDRMYSFFNSHH